MVHYVAPDGAQKFSRGELGRQSLSCLLGLALAETQAGSESVHDLGIDLHKPVRSSARLIELVRMETQIERRYA